MKVERNTGDNTVKVMIPEEAAVNIDHAVSLAAHYLTENGYGDTYMTSAWQRPTGEYELFYGEGEEQPETGYFDDEGRG